MRIVTAQLKETEAFALDQFCCGTFFPPDFAVVEEAVEPGADGDYEADNDGCDRESGRTPVVPRTSGGSALASGERQVTRGRCRERGNRLAFALRLREYEAEL